MSLYSDLQQYRDPMWGLLMEAPLSVAPSGNAVLYEAHALYVTGLVSKLTGANVNRFLSTYGAVIEDQGLIRRKPRSDEDQSHDDYTGLAYGLTRYDRTLAKAIVTFGRNHGWFYDWKAPLRLGSISSYFTLAGRIIESRGRYLKFWHRRLAGQIEHYKICAGERLNTLEWAVWLGSIVFTNPQNTSGFLLDELKIAAAKDAGHDNLAVRLADKWRINGLRRVYSGKLSVAYSYYFGKDHPFSRALADNDF